MKVAIKVFEGRDGFYQICDDWLALSEKCATHFLHYPFWYGAELESYDDKHPDVYFVAVYNSDLLVAVIPLEKVVLKKGKFSCQILELFYFNEMGACDITASESFLGSAIDLSGEIQKLTGFLPVFKGQSVSEKSIFEKAVASFGQGFSDISHYSKYIDFSSGGVDFWASYNSKFRRNLKRKLSKASALGEIKLVSESDASKLQEAFKVFLNIEGSGWKGRENSSIAAQPDKENYYQYLLDHFGAKGMCRINLLYLSNKCIAAQFTLIVGKTLHLLKIGYDESYAEISPGHILLEKLVNYGLETSQFEKISFVTGVTWIDRWKPNLEVMKVHYLFSNGLTGRMMAWALSKIRKKTE